MDWTPDQQEVLMARDNTSGKVGAVVGQNPDGTPVMADVKSTPLSELIKFNKGQNPLEAFMSNFLRQAKNPTMFSFFRRPADRYKGGPPQWRDNTRRGEKGEAEKQGRKILRKVLNLWHENRRCNMDVPARGHGRTI